MSFFLRITAAIALIILYGILFYLQYQHKILIDFSSIYYAAEQLLQGNNPYQALITHFFPPDSKLPINLNPPCVLWMFQIFVPLGYEKAFLLWTCFSLGAGIKAASITYSILQEKINLSLSKLDYWLIYFAAYPIFMNAVLSQFGFFLAFFILLGYDYSRNNHDKRAGILWGIAAAFKLFPLLLLVYAFLNKQYRLITFMISTFLCVSLLPLVQVPMSLYLKYHDIIQRVLWYGDSWNASFYGLLFRLFADEEHGTLRDVIYLKYAYCVIFVIGLILYYRKSKAHINRKEHLEAFNITLVTMLLLSPLGWLYYFPMLVLPAYMIWDRIQKGYNRLGLGSFVLTYASLMLICTPIAYIKSLSMMQCATRLTVFSCHFYGLLLMAIILFYPPKNALPSYSQKDLLLFNNAFIWILTWGVCVITYHILMTNV